MSIADERCKRILTTHAGSLPRPTSLSAKLFARVTGQSYDANTLAQELKQAVGENVRKQAEVGLDVVSDGELSKTSFQFYVTDRLSGIEPIKPQTGHRVTRETLGFPTFYKDGTHSGTAPMRYACTGPLKYVGHDHLAADLANLKAAVGGARHVDAFKLRRADGEPLLPGRRGTSVRRRRRASRGIQGDRRCRIHAADR
jgi:5-methyltetrahydropteroyltriglutamate--homocysteine methyltransferase